MADIDLDAIRARDAGYSDGFMADDSHPMLQVMRDRRALLAEVDRLTAENASIPPDVHVWALAEDAERARIRAAVERLPDRFSCDDFRADVLAAIDGECREPLGGIEQFQDEDR